MIEKNFNFKLDPDTCCFLSSSREHPIHLWDAYTGKVNGSKDVILVGSVIIFFVILFSGEMFLHHN